MKTVLKIICMYCESEMGEKDGLGVSGDSHSICRKCWQEQFPDWEYPEPESESEED